MSPEQHKPDVWPALPMSECVGSDPRGAIYMLPEDMIRARDKQMARECWKVIHSTNAGIDNLDWQDGRAFAAWLLEERFGPFDE